MAGRKDLPERRTFASMKLIIGLGNPGREYEKSRHNMGFLAIDRLAEKYGIRVNEIKGKGLSGKGIIAGEKVILIKPQTFMNNSGECARAYMDFYKVDPEDDILVIYDDIDLAPGQLRIRKKGSAGSHNGMKSVISHLGTDHFDRIRVGVGDRAPGADLIGHVLGRPSQEEEKLISRALEESVGAVELIVAGETDEAMSRYNGKKQEKPED